MIDYLGFQSIEVCRRVESLQFLVKTPIGCSSQIRSQDLPPCVVISALREFQVVGPQWLCLNILALELGAHAVSVNAGVNL